MAWGRVKMTKRNKGDDFVAPESTDSDEKSISMPLRVGSIDDAATQRGAEQAHYSNLIVKNRVHPFHKQPKQTKRTHVCWCILNGIV